MGRKKRKRSLELADDLITDIISRLPEKDLTCFTCVSKSWCSSINSTDSYLSQLRSQRTLNRPFLIIENGQYVPGGELYYNYRLELDAMVDGNPKPREIHNPFDDDHDHPCRDARVIASCEGLLVFQQCSSHKMVVSNPTTEKHHVVPPNPAGDDNVMFMGFGYDRVHDCYKLVTRRKSMHDRVLELVIYNVNNGTWKKSKFEGLDDDDYDCYSHAVGCVDGALYWCVDWFKNDWSKKFLCFVLAGEEFHNVFLPRFDKDLPISYGTVFDDRLCFVRYDPDNPRMELWLMESSYPRRWIKFLLISDSKIPAICRCCSSLIPICFSACRNKILFYRRRYDGQLFWCDLKKKRNKFGKLKARFNDLEGRIHVPICVPSLGIS